MNRAISNPNLDHIHAQAIHQGIGERMRDSILNDWAEPSHSLRELLKRLPELDENSPSIVPLVSDR